jgi:hypothetical protein
VIRLVTRADDAAMSRSANRAIRETCEHGLVRNISVMAPAPFLEDAAETLAGLPDVAFGLHVCLNCEWESPRWGPVLPPDQVPGLLAEDGRLTRDPKVLHHRGLTADTILPEIRAQLDRLREVGFDVSYIDEHMGFGWVGGLGDALGDLAAHEGLIYRMDLKRLPRPDAAIAPGDHPGRLLEQLRRAEPGTYLVVGHPAYDDEEMRAVERLGEGAGDVARDRNLQRLQFVRADILTLCRDRGIVPIRYDGLG